MRVCVISPIPTPYRDPFWATFEMLEGIELLVLYCAGSKADRPWRPTWQMPSRYRVMPGMNLALGGASASVYWNASIAAELKNWRPDALLIGGYNHPTMLRAIRFAVKSRVPWFMMCESWHRLRRSNGFARAKSWLLGRLLRTASGGLPTGALAEAYLASYGVSRERMFRLPNLPDMDSMLKTATRLRQDRAELRQELGMSNRPTILFVGRLIEQKRPQLLLEAFWPLAEVRDVDLLYVGSGVQRDDLERRVKELGLTDRVRCAGFVAPEEMIRWYVAADLFVLPSTETWGVVAFEALACGLPVVLSDQVGAGTDLAKQFPVSRFAHDDVRKLEMQLSERLDDLGSEKGAILPEKLAGFNRDTLATGLGNFLLSQRG